MSRKAIFAFLAGVSALVLGTAIASAHPRQHGAGDGHLPGIGAFGNIELLGKAIVTSTPELVADVAVNPAGTYAFLANWGEPDCEGPESGGQNAPDGGAWVVDIRDLASPKQVGFIPHHQDSRPGEGMQVVNVTTKQFSGDVLVMNNEQCDPEAKNWKGGVSLWDVSNPLKPVKLSEHFGDKPNTSDAHDIHSSFGWDAGANAYVVIVDNVEFPDVDILDITNPKRPRLIAEYDLNDFDVDQPEIGLTESFIHDMVVKQIGGRFIMLVSYWDGGFVKLDVTNPTQAVFLGDTDYANPDPELLESAGVARTPEGNGHQAEFTIDNRYIVATDEDFDPYRPTPFTITSGIHAGTTYDTASTGGGAPVTILPDRKLNGPVVYGGYGCPASAPIPPAASIPWPLLAPGEERIVVLQRGPVGDPSAPEEACFPGEKAAAGKAAGYDAVVLVARHLGSPEPLPPFCGSGAFPAEPIVTTCTTHTAFHNMFETTPNFALPYPPEPNTEPDIGTLGQRIEVGSLFDGWGYIHLYDTNTLAELDTHAVPEAHDEAFASGFGDLTVHEVAVDPDEANRFYSSYYDAGLRAFQIKGGKIVETGGYIDPNGNDFWGVETFVRNGRTIILGSDRDSGLWIFGQK